MCRDEEELLRDRLTKLDSLLVATAASDADDLQVYKNVLWLADDIVIGLLHMDFEAEK